MVEKLLSIFALSAFSTILPQCPSAGTWKPADKSFTQVIEEQGDDLHETVTALGPDGSPWILKCTIPIKGGVGKVEESTGNFDSVMSKLVGPVTRENTFTRGGKQVRFDGSVCSKDGKTRTHTESGVDIHGKPFHGTDVATKQ